MRKWLDQLPIVTGAFIACDIAILDRRRVSGPGTHIKHRPARRRRSHGAGDRAAVGLDVRAPRCRTGSIDTEADDITTGRRAEHREVDKLYHFELESARRAAQLLGAGLPSEAGRRFRGARSSAGSRRTKTGDLSTSSAPRSVASATVMMGGRIVIETRRRAAWRRGSRAPPAITIIRGRIAASKTTQLKRDKDDDSCPRPSKRRRTEADAHHGDHHDEETFWSEIHLLRPTTR